MYVCNVVTIIITIIIMIVITIIIIIIITGAHTEYWKLTVITKLVYYYVGYRLMCVHNNNMCVGIYLS